MERLASLLTISGELSRARAHLQDAITVANREDLPVHVANSLVGLSAIHRVEGAFSDALEDATQAYSLYSKKGVRNRPGMASAMLAIGSCEMYMGVEEAALKHLTRALKIFEESSDQLGLASTHLALGELKRDLQNSNPNPNSNPNLR